MTTENWIAIAAIAMATTAPILAELVKSRLNQPKTNPPDQTRARAESRASRLLRRATTSSVAHLFSLALSIYVLVAELLSTAPLTRLSVFLIAYSSAACFSALANLTFRELSLMIARLDDELEDFDHLREAFEDLRDKRADDRTLINGLYDRAAKLERELGLPERAAAQSVPEPDWTVPERTLGPVDDDGEPPR